MKQSTRTIRAGNQQMVFRKWTNKPYAVFNSLKKIIKIALLNVAYSLLALGSATSFAQEDSLRIDKKLELEEYEVVSAIEPLVFSQQARLVNLISKQDILQSAHQDIAGIISNQAALDIRQRGGYGIQSDLSLRASAFDQVLVLLNGIPISDAQTGHFNLNLPLTAQNIERIEILKGSAARIYGTNAFAGAVNIVTYPEEKNSLQFTLESGQHALYNIASALNFHKKRSRTLLSYQQSGSDGYMENTDFLLKNVFVQTQYLANGFTIDLLFGAQFKEFGANGFYSPKYPLQYEYNKAYNGHINLSFGNRFSSRISLFWRRHQDQWVLTRENPSLYQNFHQTDAYGFRSNHRFKSGFGKTLLGTEIKKESIWSTSLGESQTETKPVPWENAYLFTHYKQRSNASVFIDHQMQLGNKINVSFGFLTNWNSAYSSAINVYPGVDLSYTLNPHLKLIGSLNQAMRLPTFTDLYYSGPANEGNPDLIVEKASSFEFGLKYEKQNLQFDVVCFSRLGKNIIDWVWMEAKEKWQTQNILEQNSSGIETGFSYSSNSLINQFYLNYTYIDVQTDTHFQLTKYANSQLKHQFNIGINLKPHPHFSTNFSLGYRDRVGVFQSYDFDASEYIENPYKAVFLANAKLSYQRPKYELYLSGINVLNQLYYEYGVMQSGRWIKAGIVINLVAQNE
ncbi:MAG: TonB-dependent receptor [Bacteroidales bacterium]|nr:TonB-dependent receptor [Bacteroidales bacterium]